MKEMILAFFIAFISLFLVILTQLPGYITHFQLQLIYLAFGAMIIGVMGRVIGWI